MLEEFFVDNYKSLINVTFRQQHDNLLLGTNNAGKTNLCQALRFLATTAVIPLDECADSIAGMRQSITNYYFQQRTIHFQVKANLPFEDGKLSYHYRLAIALTPSSMSTPRLEVEEESLHVTGQGFKDTLLLENTSQEVRLLHEEDYAQGQTNFIETSAPRGATMLNRLYDMKTNKRANHFKAYLSSWQYFALSAEALRGTTHRPNYVTLNPDGSNLASCVYQLKTSNERWYRRLLGYLQRIDSRIDLINFYPVSEDTVLMFFEDKAGNRLPATNASSGTLRFLGLSYILMGQPSRLFSPMLMIEEPENGIYVSFLKDLLEMARESPYMPQVIFTTHSPYFVDLFDEHPENVFVIKGGKEHSTLEQPDTDKIRRNLETFPLGEQHFREMLT